MSDAALVSSGVVPREPALRGQTVVVLGGSAGIGDGLEERRDELRAKLPIRRVLGPADVAALAVHIMANTALTGATFDIDGGQQFV